MKQQPVPFPRRLPRSLLILCLAFFMLTGAVLPCAAFLQDTTPHLPTELEMGDIRLLVVSLDTGSTGSASLQELVLCAIQKDIPALTLTVLPGDLELICSGAPTSAKDIYASGGTARVLSALEQQLSQPLDGYIAVDLAGLPPLVDVMGGIALDITREEARHIGAATGKTPAAGKQQLNGDQALAYARIPILAGEKDTAQTRRRQQLTAALYDRLKELPPTEWIGLWDALSPMLTTGMKKSRLFLLALELLPLVQDLKVTTHRYTSTKTP